MVVPPLVVRVTAMCVVFVGSKPPHYSVAIDSVSGLDPAMDLGRAATVGLDPVFNPTLRVASRGFLRVSECIEAGTIVEVSYRGVPLAGGPARRLCSGARKAREEAVVAWGTRVRVPGFALDGLAADARRGVQVLDVTVRMPSTHGNAHDG